MAFQARVTKPNYTYVYAFPWDETTPEKDRTKTAKLFTGTVVTAIGDHDGWWQIEKLAQTNGSYLPADTWWIDPLDCERIVAPPPEPEPEPEPDFGDGDLDTLVSILKAYGIKSITLE